MAYGDGMITEADVRAADVIVDLFAQYPEPPDRAAWLEFRGALAAALADVRYAGYVEGKEVGRQEVRRTIRELLDGEGL
jgi:hypothetical protein